MKYAQITLIAVMLLVAEGCAGGDGEQDRAKTSSPTNLEAQQEQEVRKISTEEAAAIASARKWVKKSEDLLKEALLADKDVEFERFCLSGLAYVQAWTGDKEAATKNYESALALVAKKFPPEKRNNAFGCMASSQADAGLFDLARKTESMIVGENCKGWGYSRIMQVQIEKKDFDAAKQTAIEADLGYIYLSLAQAQAEAGLYADAMKTADCLLERSPQYAVKSFAEIAMRQVLSGDREAGTKTFARAHAILRDSAAINKEDRYYANIAMAEAEAGMFDAAVATLKEVSAPRYRYPVLITLAETVHKGGDKKMAAEYLERAKKDVRGLDSREVVVKGLCAIAVVESKLIGKKEAWPTLQEAHNVCRKGGSITGADTNFFLLLRSMFEAGFRDRAQARAQQEPYSNPHLAEIALLYANAGEFAQAHRMLGLIGEDQQFYAKGGSSYDYYLTRIADLEIAAGVTEHIPALVAKIDAVLGERDYKFATIAKILARAGLEEDLARFYGSLKDNPADERFRFCIGAAMGFSVNFREF